MNIAQKFQADASYGPGTVVQIGGEFDVTSAQPQSTSIVGVVTSTPGILLNPDLTGTNVVAVAIHGVVQCTVSGSASKGDQLIISPSGALQSVANYTSEFWVLNVGNVVGIALEDATGNESIIDVQLGVC